MRATSTAATATFVHVFGRTDARYRSPDDVGTHDDDDSSPLYRVADEFAQLNQTSLTYLFSMNQRVHPRRQHSLLVIIAVRDDQSVRFETTSDPHRPRARVSGDRILTERRRRTIRYRERRIQTKRVRSVRFSYLNRSAVDVALFDLICLILMT